MLIFYKKAEKVTFYTFMPVRQMLKRQKVYQKYTF